MYKALTPMIKGKFVAVDIDGKKHICMTYSSIRKGLYIVINGRKYYEHEFKY